VVIVRLLARRLRDTDGRSPTPCFLDVPARTAKAAARASRASPLNFPPPDDAGVTSPGWSARVAELVNKAFVAVPPDSGGSRSNDGTATVSSTLQAFFFFLFFFFLLEFFFFFFFFFFCSIAPPL